MSAVAALREPVGVLEPGGEVSCEVSVLNTGTIVDQFEIDVLGAPSAWAIVEPPVMSLFPNTQQVATIRFRPPLSHSVAPGPTPFAVRVKPTNSPDFQVTEEGTVILAPFKDVSAELIPQRCEGRLRGKMHIAVDSRGNFPFSVAVLASDPAGALIFRPTPGIIELRPNQAAFAKLRIVPRQHHIRGGVKQQRFTVVLDDNGTPLATLTGTYNQPPVIAKWLLALLILLTALLIWLLLLRPAIKNTATASAAAAVNGQKAAAAAAEAQAHKAQAAAALATANAQKLQAQEKAVAASLKKELKQLNSAQTQVKAATSNATAAIQRVNNQVREITSTTAPPTAKPLAKSLEAVVAPGTLSTVKFTVGPKDSFSLTDFVLTSLASSIGSSSSGFTQNGQVRIQQITPGAPNAQNLVVVSLSQLNNVPAMSAKLTTPIIFGPGQSLGLNVQCAANQPACDVGLLIDGQFTQPTTTTVQVLKTTAPGIPTSVAATPGVRNVTVTWTPPASNGGATIAGYDVYSSTTPGGQNFGAPPACVVNGASSTSCTVGSLTPGQIYYFKVEAVNSIGNSSPSKEVSATPHH
jgi:hypothetical protein